MPTKILRRVATETKLDSGGAVVRLAVELPVRCQCGAVVQPTSSASAHVIGGAIFFNVACTRCTGYFTVQLDFT